MALGPDRPSRGLSQLASMPRFPWGDSTSVCAVFGTVVAKKRGCVLDHSKSTSIVELSVSAPYSHYLPQQGFGLEFDSSNSKDQEPGPRETACIEDRSNH